MKTHDWWSERSDRRLRVEGSVAAVRSSSGTWPGKGLQRTVRENDGESRTSGRLGDAEKGLGDLSKASLAVGALGGYEYSKGWTLTASSAERIEQSNQAENERRYPGSSQRECPKYRQHITETPYSE